MTLILGWLAGLIRYFQLLASDFPGLRGTPKNRTYAQRYRECDQEPGG